ncbi:MAG: histidine phosphatase family protein [Chloroflexota bacterium]
MVTTLYLIRHGETVGSETKRYKGSIDVPLSERGLEQMKRTAHFVVEHLRHSSPEKRRGYLRDVHENPHSGDDDALQADPFLAAVYCSAMSRAVRSAEAVAEPFELVPTAVRDLRERNFGIWEGMSFLEIRQRYPDEFEAWARDPLTHSPPQGESTVQVRDRVMTAIAGILGSHAGDDIAVVAHGGVNRVALCEIMGLPLEHMFRIEQDCACVNIVEFWDRYPVVKLLNGGPRG